MAVTRDPATVLWLVKKFTSLSPRWGPGRDLDKWLLHQLKEVLLRWLWLQWLWLQPLCPLGGGRSPAQVAFHPRATPAVGRAGSAPGRRGEHGLWNRFIPTAEHTEPPPYPAVPLEPRLSPGVLGGPTGTPASVQGVQPLGVRSLQAHAWREALKRPPWDSQVATS